MTTFEAITEDVAILLQRALANRSLTFFGEDGCGKYGRSDFPFTGEIDKFLIDLTADDQDDPGEIYGIIRMYIRGYDSTVTGHAITDNNLRISLNQLLDNELLDRKSLDWAELSQQGKDYIALEIDVKLLLGWT